MLKQIKIIIVIIDSSATLKTNGLEFCSEDTSKLWDRLVLSNSETDLLLNVFLGNALYKIH